MNEFSFFRDDYRPPKTRKEKAQQVRAFRQAAKDGSALGRYMVKMCRQARSQRLLMRERLSKEAQR